MRRALIILDGLGDRPDPTLGGRTPLEAARTPNLDRLAGRGELGLVRVLGEGIAPESDAGALALLGVDPRTESPGRGVLEALGAGIDLAPGDVALRLNFATADPSGKILDSRVGRSLSSEESAQLARTLNASHLLEDRQIRAEVRPTVGHRGVLWLHPLSGGPLSPAISNADPFYDQVGGAGQARRVAEPRLRPVRPLDDRPASARTAAALDRFLALAPTILAADPTNLARADRGTPVGNMLLVRSAGALPSTPTRSFTERTGLDGAAITEMPVERGIARWLGLEDRFVGPMGADRDAAWRERASVAADALERHGFAYIHLKGPDEPGHDGLAELKREIIEGIDRSFFAPLLERLSGTDVKLAVSADHATPCQLKAHSDDPVPLLIVGGVARSSPPAQAGPPPKFGERACASGSLGALSGADVMPRLLA